MPEMYFDLTWPDSTRETCYSPSLVVREHFSLGTAYSLAEFVARSRVALGIASERVQARYGVPCGRAMAQLARIERTAARFVDTPGATVRVDAFRG